MGNSTPNGNNLYVGRGKVYVDLWSAGAPSGNWRFLGNVERIEGTFSISTIEKKSSMDGSSSLLKQAVIGSEAEVSMTLSEWTKENIALALLGSVSTWTQSSGTATANALGNLKKGYALDTGKKKITVTNVVKTSGSVTLVAATSMGGTGDYFVDSDAGLIYIFDTTATAGLVDGDALTWSGSYPSIASAEMVTALSAGMNTVSVKYVPASDQVSGPRNLVDIPQWIPNPDGTLALLTDEFGTLNLKGKVLKDVTKPVGQEFWVMRKL